MAYTLKGVAGANYNQLTEEEKAAVQAAGDSAVSQYQQSVGAAWNNPESGYQSSAPQIGQEAAQRAAEALFTSKSNTIQSSEEQKAADMNTFITQNPNATSLPTNLDPTGQYAVVNGVLTQKSAIAQDAANKAGVQAGTLTAVPIGSGTGYVPTGSAADKLQAGIASGQVNPNDPTAQMAASMQGNNLNAPGVQPVAPTSAPNTPVQAQQPTTEQPAQQGLAFPSFDQALQTVYQSRPDLQELYLPNGQARNPDDPRVAGIPTLQDWATTYGVNEDSTLSTASRGNPASTNKPTPIQNTLDGLGVPMPNPNSNPITAFADTYQQIYKSLGLDTVKQQFDLLAKERETLANELNDKISNINDNPWLSEGDRVRQINSLQNKYEGRMSNLVDRITLAEKLLSDGRDDAQFIATQAINASHNQAVLDQNLLIKKMELAEKAAEAENKLTSSTTKSTSSTSTSKGATPRVASTTPTTNLKPTVDTTGEVKAWILANKRSNPNIPYYDLWGQLADEMKRQGLNPTNYDKVFWEVLHPDGLAGYAAEQKKKSSTSTGGDNIDALINQYLQ